MYAAEGGRARKTRSWKHSMPGKLARNEWLRCSHLGALPGRPGREEDKISVIEEIEERERESEQVRERFGS